MSDVVMLSVEQGLMKAQEELELRLAAMTDDERRHFENVLTLRAYVLGWTGDPLCQPIESVRAAYLQMRQERGSAT